jgi:hypothetical protein
MDIVYPEGWIDPNAVPESIAMWQARSVLIDAGLLNAVNAYINGIADPIIQGKARAKFEYSSTMRRDDPLLIAIAPALGLTDAQIDTLFIQAAALR